MFPNFFFMDICTLWYVISSTPVYVLQNRHNCFQFDVEQWDIFFIAEHRKYFWIYSSVGTSVH